MKRLLPLSALLLLTGCSSGSSGNTVTLVDQESNGYTLFKQSCAGCHGDNLQGRAGPNLQHVGGRLTPDKITQRIQLGASGMPAFQNKLEDAQITELATWLSKQK
ncbi:c-type cytochrome [Tumebacillus permanentifrigoris]|uniref:Cytochrome c551 n=1 Tax=Tumebacillus permanentifrigoris TaxID=378543 RepID=A0A316DDT2_9BACL|nr:cytochrome c [Tumebacillus permanentifrigoris]PWK14950.1 cytochrome c551 [Tumebacillus permanentifrigoris]